MCIAILLGVLKLLAGFFYMCRIGILMISKILCYLIKSKFYQVTKDFWYHSYIFPTCRKIQPKQLHLKCNELQIWYIAKAKSDLSQKLYQLHITYATRTDISPTHSNSPYVLVTSNFRETTGPRGWYGLT